MERVDRNVLRPAGLKSRSLAMIRKRRAMDELYNIGQKVAQGGQLPDGAMGDPEQLAKLFQGANMEEYLQSYEKMLQEGIAPEMSAPLDQVDHEGGITTRPEPGFVVKAKDSVSGTKIFINIVSSPHIEAPHMKSYTELEGEQGCRVPLSIGTPVEARVDKVPSH
eukprot:symbB.v1.2.038706.t1/scaffold6130.1/size20737/2